MLPHSQQQQNFRTSRLLTPLSPSFPPRLRKLGREGVSTQQIVAQSSESGFTIVEALLAIIVVSILMTAVAPVLVLATANRVQAKRVELAVNAAKSYIDRVRSDPSLAPPINDTPGSSSAQYFAAINPPRPGPLVCNVRDPSYKGYCSTPALTNAKYRLFCVDGDGDNLCNRGNIKDMIVQVAGYQPNPDATATDNLQRAAKGYLLAVRVYRADGFKDSGPFKRSVSRGSTNTKVLAGTNTAGLGDRKAPLVEMTTQIIGKDTTYDDLRQQLGQPVP